MRTIKSSIALFTLIIIHFIIPSNKIFACDNNSYSKTLEYIENDVVYTLNESNHTASVSEVKNVNLAEVIIPESVKNYKVVSIADKAFGKPVYKKWSTIILPDSIVKIDLLIFAQN